MSLPLQVPGEDTPFRQQCVLGDGIFSGETWIIGPVGNPTTGREKTFTRDHESKRKDVERLFGVVQGRFKMVRSGNRLETANHDTACSIIRFCFMLHNMIVKLVADGSELDASGMALSANSIVHEFDPADAEARGLHGHGRGLRSCDEESHRQAGAAPAHSGTGETSRGALLDKAGSCTVQSLCRAG